MQTHITLLARVEPFDGLGRSSLYEKQQTYTRMAIRAAEQPHCILSIQSIPFPIYPPTHSVPQLLTLISCA